MLNLLITDFMVRIYLIKIASYDTALSLDSTVLQIMNGGRGKSARLLEVWR